MRHVTFAIAAVLACAASPAPAQSAPGALASEAPAAKVARKTADASDAALSSRFVFNRVDGGFLRLDNRTGQISFCGPRAIGWACQAVPEDRAALENEIARLQAEVASLKAEVATLRAPPHPPAGPTPPAPDKNGDQPKLQGDLAHARAAFENAWRRLVEIIVQLQKEMMHKG